MRPHGTVARYTSKADPCRCDECRCAMNEYARERRGTGTGDPPPLLEPPKRFIPRSWVIAADYPEMVR